MIMGVVKPDTGRVITGQTMKFGYFTQNGIEHRDDMRVIEIVKEAAESIQLESGQQVSPSQFLLHFGFSPTVQYNYYGKSEWWRAPPIAFIDDADAESQFSDSG